MGRDQDGKNNGRGFNHTWFATTNYISYLLLLFCLAYRWKVKETKFLCCTFRTTALKGTKLSKILEQYKRGGTTTTRMQMKEWESRIFAQGRRATSDIAKNCVASQGFRRDKVRGQKIKLVCLVPESHTRLRVKVFTLDGQPLQPAGCHVLNYWTVKPGPDLLGHWHHRYANWEQIIFRHLGQLTFLQNDSADASSGNCCLETRREICAPKAVLEI